MRRWVSTEVVLGGDRLTSSPPRPPCHTGGCRVSGRAAGRKRAALTPRLYLFDIDGTILRGGTAVHRDAFTHAFRTVYHRELTLDGILAAGRTDMWLLVEPLRSIGLADEEIWAGMPHAFAAMEEYAHEHISSLSDNVLPGVREVLRSLAGARSALALLTGNLSGIAHAKMRAARLGEYFATGGFGEESLERADLVPVALAHTADLFQRRLLPPEVVVIGDTPLDVAAGKAHGTLTCGVATGRFTADELRACGADLVFESLADPESAVRQLMELGTEPPGGDE